MPVLYTFLRCPFAIRARVALVSAGIKFRQVEVSLRDKPPEMLALSPKGTVPVMRLPSGEVFEESLDIMRWALRQSDPNSWLKNAREADPLIEQCDHVWKPLLDRYKYAERHPSLTREQHRIAACVFPEELDRRLSNTKYLCGDHASLADVAIFPFVRQFSRVEPGWFAASELSSLRAWLDEWLACAEFRAAMVRTGA